MLKRLPLSWKCSMVIHFSLNNYLKYIISEPYPIHRYTQYYTIASTPRYILAYYSIKLTKLNNILRNDYTNWVIEYINSRGGR